MIEKQDVLLTFLKDTKDGKYAPVECGDLACIRVDVQTEPDYSECEYLYSIR